MFIETQSRAVAKTITYRMISSLVTTGFVFAFTRRLDTALAIGGLDLLTKIAIYWVHERTWEKVRYGRKRVDPFVLWFTGLSGAGKTTLSLKISRELKNRGLMVEHLDGDTVRNLLPNIGFSREERNEHVRRVGLLASLLEKHGVFVIASLISPYEESRNFVRGLCINFIEIYVATPLDTCEARDVKGLYARARKGEVRNFTGIDSEYEPPKKPDLTVSTDGNSEAIVVKQILEYLKRRL